MSKRIYNIFFHTHTVSGIVISIALFVIFFAGAFALFKDEIQAWEEGKNLTHIERKNVDLDKILNHLNQYYNLNARDLQINFGEKSDKFYVYMSSSKDTLTNPKGKKSEYIAIDINTLEKKTYDQYYNLGEFLYRLHFFGQIPTIGIYLAGFIAFFFLFAIVTGVIIHWKKIIPNFYYFNPKIALRRVWADAHTALGIIGLPFQFVFAVSGAYFGLSVLVLLPAYFLYNGNQDQLMEDMRPERKKYEWVGVAQNSLPNINQFIQKTADNWENFHLTRGFISNYGGKNMKCVFVGELATNDRFIGIGSLVFDVNTGKIEATKNPNKLSYLEDSQFLLTRLHFGNFGGIAVKLIYFILAFVTCFVIISGVLVWIETRNKKSMNLSQRMFTAKVGHIYLAICLTMLPVTALAFLFVKITHGVFQNNLNAIYAFYFPTWLMFILFFRFKRDNYFTNKYNLLLGALFGFLIPIFNGFMSGNWLWVTYTQYQHDILIVDLTWIGIAITAFLFYQNIKPEIKENSTFTKYPINHKNYHPEK